MFLGSSLSLMLVSSWRSVIIGLWATRILNGCRMREIFSDMPFMYGIVAVVVGVALSLASVVVIGLWVLRWMKSVDKSVGKSKGRFPRCSASQFLLQQQTVNTLTVLRSLGRQSERLANDYITYVSTVRRIRQQLWFNHRCKFSPLQRQHICLALNLSLTPYPTKQN